MRFKNLAWGSFIFANVTRGDSTYGRLAKDQDFLDRLATDPSSDDFQKLRQFLVNYGVHYAPVNLAQQYEEAWPTLKDHVKRLAGQRLETCDLNDKEIQDAISGAYGCLQYPYVWGGDTVASKVSHFFNISLFVMWDNDIQLSHQKFGTQGYLEFLQSVQVDIVEATDDFQRLSLSGTPAEFLSQQLGYDYSRPLTKFLDDYNWVTITKGWPSTAPAWLVRLFAEA